VTEGAPRAAETPLPAELLRKLEYLRVVSRRLHAGRFSALNRSAKLGRGIDFADHRPYAPGDDFKDIDWNLYGRLDRFMVRLAEEETELNLHLLVDCSRSMGPEKAEYARLVAAALSYIALAHLDRVHVWPFGEKLLKPLKPPRNKAQAVQVYRYLAGVDGGAATDMEGAMRAFAGISRARGVALVLSDFLAPDGWQGAMDVLRSARFEPAMLQVSSPAEADVPARGEVLLEDRETGRTLRVRVTEKVAAAYRAAFLAHGRGLREYARANNLFCAHGRSDQPFEEMVLRTMRAERLLA